jgi:hypothetical protein
MSKELLPHLDDTDPRNREAMENFIRTVRRFSSAQWREYSELYPEKSLPAGVITVGSNYVGLGRIERFEEGKAKPQALPAGGALAFDQATVIHDFHIIGIPEGSTMEQFLSYLDGNNAVLPEYCLFNADNVTWQKMVGQPRQTEINDDYEVLNYTIGDKGIDLWTFDVLNRVNTQPLNQDGSIGFTTTDSV